jgi:mycofactocin system creatininase family protein
MPGMLAEAAWPDMVEAELVLVPVGSLEQHGPHLPLDTDTVIAEAVTRGVAARLPGAWIAPALSYGASGEHQAFAGTSSIGTEALRQVLVELVRSMRTWASRVVLVNAHGGNAAALASAVGQLVAEEHDVIWVACATEEADPHGGFTETSLMLHLRPGSVRGDRAAPGNTAPFAEILPAMLRSGVRAVSANGVLGDPTGATAEEGRRVHDAMVAAVLARLSGESV